MAASGGRRSAGIFGALRRDHRRIALLMQRISTDGGDPEIRDGLFFRLRNELEIHAVAEESIFYAALREHPGAVAAVDAASADHARMTALLDDLSDMCANEGTWLETFLVLKALVERHMQHEETALFELARGLLDRRQSGQLGRELEAEERRLQKAA